ncbi:unnamed protein product, partial [Iphiclides podalirius]
MLIVEKGGVSPQEAAKTKRLGKSRANETRPSLPRRPMSPRRRPTSNAPRGRGDSEVFCERNLITARLMTPADLFHASAGIVSVFRAFVVRNPIAVASFEIRSDRYDSER